MPATATSTSTARRWSTCRKPTVDEQQRENYIRAAELTALIRSLETDGVTVSVGGEIGEVGHAELDRRGAARLPRRVSPRARRDARPAPTGITKVSVQTGTSHGGVPLPDGGVAEVKLDFEVLRELGEVARSYGAAGAVQHGASTLPDELFHRFPAVETAEIHLATGFQNALYEHPAFPDELHREIEAWCFANAADERKADQTDQQFVYTTRKKAIGPFKRAALGPRDEGRDPGRAASQDRVPVHRARRQRLARHGRRVHPPGRGPSPAAGCAARGRRRRLTPGDPPADVGRPAKRSLTGRNTVLSSRAGRTGERESARIVPRVPRVTPRGQSRTERARR